MRKSVKKWGVIVSMVPLVLLLTLAFCGCSSDGAEAFGEEIEFPKGTDSELDTNATLTYDTKKLSAQLSDDSSYYVSYDPVETNYEIAAKLGFNTEDYSLWEDGTRSYSAEGRDQDKSLLIEPNGRFSYKTGIKGTAFQITLGDNECYDIAKKFLQESDLFLEEFGTKASVTEAEALNSASEGYRVTALGVSFSAEGKYSNSYATVTVNGNGEVTSVSYNAKEYSQHKKVKLISVENAIERIKQNKALIDVGELYSYSDLKFEKVSVGYYEHQGQDNGILVQPVYRFEGTVTATDGSTQPFTITTQANKYK